MALLRRPNGLPRVFEKEIDFGININNFLVDLGFTHEEIRFMQVFVSNTKEKNQKISLNYEIKDDDEIFITIPIGGG